MTFKAKKDIANGDVTPEPLIVLGGLGLPQRFVTRIHAFRREQEAAMRAAGQLDRQSIETLRSACNAFAAEMRGNLRLERAERKQLKLTTAEVLATEAAIERAGKRRETLVAELERRRERPNTFLADLLGLGSSPTVDPEAKDHAAGLDGVSCQGANTEAQAMSSKWIPSNENGEAEREVSQAERMADDDAAKQRHVADPHAGGAPLEPPDNLQSRSQPGDLGGAPLTHG